MLTFHLRAKLIITMLTLVLVTAAGIGLLSGYQSQKLILFGVEESSHNKVDAAVQKVEGFLSAINAQMDFLAALPEVKAFNLPAMEPALRALLQKNPAVTNVFVATDKSTDFFVLINDKGSIQRWVPPADFDARTRGWYKEGKAKGKLGVTAPYQDTASKEMVITIFVPYSDAAGAFAGVLGADILLSDLTASIASLKFGQSGYGLMIDAGGVILAHPDKGLLAKKLAEQGQGLQEIAGAMMAGKTGSGTYEFSGETKYVFYRPIPLVNWSIGATIPEAELRAPLRTLYVAVSVISLLALLLTAAVVLYTASRISRPIVVVAGQLETVAQGGGDLTQRLPVVSSDEVGNLARWFNAFMQKLAAIITQVAGTAHEVQEGSDQLAHAVHQQAQVTNQMAALVAEVAKGAQEQNRTVHEAQSSIGTLSTAIEEIARGAQQQAATVAQTQSLTLAMSDEVGQAAAHIRRLSDALEANAASAARGNDAVMAVVSGMQTLRQEMTQTLENVGRLDEGSRQIGAIVEAITAIANQTNMLALNAAIEAARAGEQGRGFAIVAEEVRGLAEKSRSSSAEIAAIIKGLSGAIEATVRAMNASGHSVAEGSRLAEQAGKHLALIQQDAGAARTATAELLAVAGGLEQSSRAVGSAMTNLAAVAQETTALTEEMAAASTTVVDAVSRISTISQENAAAAEEGAASAEELSASSEQITATAASLAKSAEALQSMVSRFKVK